MRRNHRHRRGSEDGDRRNRGRTRSRCRPHRRWQRAEHYEIAAYGTLAHFADLLGEQRAKDLLGETLEEEKAADEKLSTIAMSDVNRQALTSDGEESDEGSGIARGLQGGMRRVAEAMGMAHERQGRSGARRGSRSTKRTVDGSSRARGGARAGKKR